MNKQVILSHAGVARCYLENSAFKERLDSLATAYDEHKHAIDDKLFLEEVGNSIEHAYELYTELVDTLSFIERY